MLVRAGTWPDSPGWLRAWWTEVDLEQGSLETAGREEEGKNEPNWGTVDWELECECSLWRVCGPLWMVSCS